MENIRESYIARFEEMETDLRRQFGEELFTEASQHGEDGSIIFDPDDELPRRIDCATPGGEEYNLEPGDPLPPTSADEFADYPFKVKVHAGTWQAMVFSVKFNEPLSDGEWDDLVGLLRGWFMTGFWGGFGGYLHSLQGLTYGGRSCQCVLDLGSAEVIALHALLNAVTGFGAETAEIEKVTFGEAPTLVS